MGTKIKPYGHAHSMTCFKMSTVYKTCYNLEKETVPMWQIDLYFLFHPEMRYYSLYFLAFLKQKIEDLVLSSLPAKQS
jgi:hypothetical protein